MYTDTLRRLSDTARRKETPGNAEPTVGISFKTMLQHTGPFWSRISYQKEQSDDSAASPILTWPNYSWFSPVP